MVQLREQDLQDVLFARAFEPTGDPADVLSKAEGEAASRRARNELTEAGEENDAAAFVVRRAAVLRRRVDELQPQLAAWRRSAVWRGPPAWFVMLVSMLVGLGVDRLGDSGRINLLSFPVLGLLVWNLAVYVAILLSPLMKRKRPGESEGAASRRGNEGLVARTVLWAASPERLWRGRHARVGKAELGVHMQRYMRDWFRVGSGLHWTRVKVSLHLAALGVMAGTIGGMYMRGLVLHYEASWESTFLSADAVHRLLDMLFRPAAQMLGTSVPDVEAIQQLRVPKSGSAAFWIHAWALTGAWLVLVPRALLAATSALRARRMARRIELDFDSDAYFMKLLAANRGQGTRAFVQTYSFDPGTRGSEGLTTLLLDLLGGRTRVERLASCDYGQDPALPPASVGGALCYVVLFSLAQSAELEVHGVYLEHLMAELREHSAPASLLVILDEGPFLERLPQGDEGQSRLNERRRSWQRILTDVGVEALFAQLAGWSDPAVLERARDVLTPLGGERAAS